MHTALLVAWHRRRVMIDCGDDWRGKISHLDPAAIVITHAHSDHAGALRNGTPCPVFATQETWSRIRGKPIAERIVIHVRKPIDIYGIRFEAFALEHSIRAPAVGYRITAGRACVFYSPDVVAIHDRHEALRDIQFYIGDGASLKRGILRKRGNTLIGHASIRTQLEWCRSEGVRRAIFTHCGSQVVAGNESLMQEDVAAFGKAAGVKACVATDGLELVL